ncbi:hypothetical protein [Paenibacillus terrae]|uniref:hypothetical protein n=1 Tax=Paenibacillus terrae TaxID=159743 RepID=UPI001BAE89D3|nr:hypothetical protein [Paenibacillus terrae]
MFTSLLCFRRNHTVHFLFSKRQQQHALATGKPPKVSGAEVVPDPQVVQHRRHSPGAD